MDERGLEQIDMEATKESTCLVCLVGQRIWSQMLWCDKCPKQLCLGHATASILKDWYVDGNFFYCPACNPRLTKR